MWIHSFFGPHLYGVILARNSAGTKYGKGTKDEQRVSEGQDLNQWSPNSGEPERLWAQCNVPLRALSVVSHAEPRKCFLDHGSLECICRKLFPINRAILRMCRITESVQGPQRAKEINLMGKQTGFVSCILLSKVISYTDAQKEKVFSTHCLSPLLP